MPSGRWLQAQSWLDLLFLHWPVEPAVLRTALPRELPLDTFDGWAWLGITPFELAGLRLHDLPPVPGVSRFPETNVRTYTTVDGVPGIWFLSLDAASRFAVAAARLVYRLPYHRAAMAIARDGDTIAYRTRRRRGDAELVVGYRPTGPVAPAQRDTLEHFIAERYRLYTVDAHHRVLYADIAHPPWPLQPATAEIERNTMVAPYGIELSGEPVVHYARRQDVRIWAPRPLGG